MMRMEFLWDERKNVSNQRKHGVSFEEAQTVFFDESAFEYDDPDHSEEEERFLMLGLSCRLRILVISYCFSSQEERIRIISARKATRKESRIYARGEP
ncbi:MAG TPA: BrnT family toxin [bacterium]|nr:BrnT family toxin [bacterium]HQO33032.1 BrnT family toxin [bacterium]